MAGSSKILLACDWGDKTRAIASDLERAGFVTCLIANGDLSRESILRESPSAVIAEINGSTVGSQRAMVIQKFKQESELPVVALVTREYLAEVDSSVDDFVVSPCDTRELVTRLRRALKTKTDPAQPPGPETVTCDDLVIDLAKCEVTLGGKRVDLTFREYELLKFLASNRDRVFTREALLNRVWGYDYLGGERTVDVHVRRLRGKIEQNGKTYVETVRNVGYKFKS